MPSRPRSHQLESTSIQRLENLLPDQWVCRKKSDDYGVDLEIEVFDESGNSTGLTFLVQLKATDDEALEKKVSIKVDRLSYLASHDAPAVVVRYCAPKETMHFSWVSNLMSQVQDPTAATTTIHFSETELWSEETPDAILRTLKVYRRLNRPAPQVPIGLSLDDQVISEDNRYAIKSAFSDLCNYSNVFCIDDDPASCLPVLVTASDSSFKIAVDVVSSVTDGPIEMTSTKVKSSLLYALALICGRFGFNSQLKEICQIICDEGFTTEIRFLASKVSEYALSWPALASKLAKMNGLHNESDEAYFSFFVALRASSGSREERQIAAQKFIRDRLEAGADASSESLASFHYNLANSLMNAGDYLGAVSHFNQARKKDSSYLQRYYFLRELAATLFFRHRFSLAAKLYSTSLRIKPKTQTAICSGDAHFYSASFEDAEKDFDLALQLAKDSDDTFSEAESAIKLWLCHFVPTSLMPLAPIGSAWISDPSFLFEQISSAVQSEQYDLALASMLLIAFLEDDDLPIWTESVKLALASNDMALFELTFICSFWRHQHRMYEQIRSLLREYDMPHEMISRLDALVDTLDDEKRENPKNRFTARFPNPSEPNKPVEVQFDRTHSKRFT